MTHRGKGGRRLRTELLEPRLALSYQSVLPNHGAPTSFLDLYPDALDHADPAVRAALERITTTAPADALFFNINPVGPVPGASTGGGDVGASLVESSELIGLTALRNDVRFAGIDGHGYSVVVLDTGIDLDHPFFGPDDDHNGVADRIVYAADFVGNRPSADDVNGHGTHVSSIIASQDATYTGMAPGVNIIHLRVLNDGGVGTAASIEAALQWVVAHVAEYNIASVNMSLSTPNNLTEPDTRPDMGFSDELAAIAAQDVIIVSAAGNLFDGAPGVAYPAADPNSLAIGATWDVDVPGGPFIWSTGAIDFTAGADRITAFSQRHPTMTTVFAPGASITAASVGGGIRVLSGTSMAAPHIAGIAALAQQLAVATTGHRLSLSDFRDLLRETGIPIFDGDDEDANVPSTFQEYRRLDVLALANAILSGGAADLAIPGGLKVDVPSAPAGGAARVSYTTANQGSTATGSFSGRFYLSIDETIDASDTLLTSVVDNLAPGQAHGRAGFAVPLPAGVTPGAYYLGIVLDEADTVAEGNETNNIAVAPLTVAGPNAEIWMFDVDTGKPAISGSLIDFGTQDEGSGEVVKTFRIYNDGPEILTLGPLSLPPGFLPGSFPTSIPAGGFDDFTIEFSAGNPLGIYTGLASFATNDPDEHPFELSLKAIIVEADDFGNDAASAYVVEMPAAINGSILARENADWFRIQAVAGIQYAFEITLGTLPDSVLRLTDSNGTSTLALDDNSGSGLGSLINWTAPRDGLFFLEVSRNGTTFGTYQLSLTAEDDHGGQASAATAISDPNVSQGVIETAGDADWFAFAALAGVEYHLDITLGSLGASQLRLIGVDGQTPVVITAQDVTPNIGNSTKWTAPASGTYYIVIETASPTLLGTYELELTGDDDFGDNAANAAPLSIGGAIAGVIETAGDGDWFAVDVLQGARYRLAIPTGTVTEAVIRVFNSGGTTVLATSDDFEGGPFPFVEWTAPASGQVFVEVSAEGLQTGAYNLTAAIVDDHGNDADAATALTDPGTLSGVIAPADDVDWIRFEANAGLAYRFAATPGTLPAVRLRLIDADGTTVLEEDAATAGQFATIDWAAPSDGVYYLEVAASVAGQMGGYQLSITSDDAHGDTPQNATPLAIPHFVDGAIELPGDVDWFSLETLPGLAYRVEVGLGTLPNARLRVYEADGVTLVGESTSDGDPLTAVQWTSKGGTYLVEVSESAETALADALQPAVIAPVGGDYRLTPSLISALPGDYDGDIDVDGDDFLVWQRLLGLGSQGAASPLDTQGFEDYALGLLQAAGRGWVKLGSAGATAHVEKADDDPGNAVVRVHRDGESNNIPGDNDHRWAVPLAPVTPTNNSILILWDMRVPATGRQDGALGPFVGVEAYDDQGVFGLLGSFGVDATSRDLVYQQQDTGYIVDTGRKASADVWHSFAISLDFALHQYTVYFDGQPLATTGMVDRGPTHAALDQLTDADISVLTAQLNDESGDATGTAYYDNFRILNGASGSYLPADGNRDGIVDVLDLQIWRDHQGLDFSDDNEPQPVVIEVDEMAATARGGMVSAPVMVEVADAMRETGKHEPATVAPLSPFGPRTFIADGPPRRDDFSPPRRYTIEPADLTFRDRAFLAIGLPSSLGQSRDWSADDLEIGPSASGSRADKSAAQVDSELDAALAELI